MSRQTPDYGLDGGRAVRAMFIVGLAGAIGGFILVRWTLTRHLGLAYTLQIFGFCCLILASLMFASSRFGKLHARDRILARLKLRGDEAVLDVGCGHGLLLIAAAKLLPRGHAVGIDLWSQWEQSDNSREATLRNAALEGVAERVSVHDGDMRKLPFADRSFDATVAHFAIHNVHGREGRREAIREIVRSLNHGGQVAISDVFSVGLYADEMRKSGMADVEISGLSFWTFPPARTVTARKPSQPGLMERPRERASSLIPAIRRKNMDQVSTLERVFSYKAKANNETLTAMRQFDDTSPAKEIAIRVLSHTYVVDRIFAANLRRAEHGYTSPNTSDAPSLEELSAAINTSDQWYIDYVSRLDEAQLAERIDFTFTDGLPGRMSREEMLWHVAIHGAGHRGQVGWIMMENSITPPGDGFTSYLHKAEASSRRRPAGSSGTVERLPDENRLNMARLAKQGPVETSATGAKEMSRLDDLTESIRAAVGADSGLSKTLKFDLKGEGFIYIDGGWVINEDKPADLTLTLTIDDLKAMSQGKLAPMTAMISGRLKLSDMGVAANLQGKLQALFSKMQAAS